MRKALLITDGDYHKLYGKFPVGLKSFDKNGNCLGLYEKPICIGATMSFFGIGGGDGLIYKDQIVEIEGVTGAYNTL